ncbi:phosphohydrolase [Flavobacterium branchiophilum]|uniref:HD/PDEase domain-containing protein n=1 Tax=Flavobacterium branchiophilum TaxID=55197 RepID=A0A543G392_9FLAO|nr:HD domain-containing protein [Flavobacterium branchiophilum]OXA76276.1 phosphohydrolase [Flavobacterium branchiophilum] [Flavobacterium branchiophilum NBRC 15030 = ATCC 35035]TQM40527.1 uncharacterized protein BC670_1418 [Flavobacterium branchiophilum]GEM55082.1 phosphohydrolase [Flavobacterium branchiophilum NBRC 15030 = ATCC 35035]
MTTTKLINNTIQYVQKELYNAESGHDWFHVARVYQNALLIAQNETCNLLVVSLAALLHDIADSKFYGGNETIAPQKARYFLENQQVEPTVIEQVVLIIINISFKGGHQESTYHSIELQIVQDADRLDALGAIGIARTFNYGGFKNRMIYDPSIKPEIGMSKEAYKNSTAPTINHFYEKLLLLKDQMNTAKGKELATERHRFMEMYLEQFYKEWNVTTHIIE